MGFALLGPSSGAAQAQAVTEFSTGITGGATPSGINTGPDGNLWFTEQIANRIGRITPLGILTEFGTGITTASVPTGIAVGSDGNLWFTEQGASRIGRITPLGVVTEFSAGITPVLVAQTLFITAGPDGNLWFTEASGNRIGRITPLGVVTEFNTGLTPAALPDGITAGPDGSMWFTEAFGNRIGRITPLGVVTEFASFGVFAGPGNITAGPDGGMWFTVIGNGVFGDAIGRITTGPLSATSFHATAPCRVLDTRSAPSALGGPALAAGAKRDFVVTGTCGIPAAAVSISVNVTITEPTAAATLFNLPAQFPVLTFQAGTTRANNAFLLLARDGSGTLSLSNDLPSGTVQLIVDMNGWWE